MNIRHLLCWLVACCAVLPLSAAETIRIGLHLSAPWSYYSTEKKLDGIEYQLVSRIFSQAGYQVEYELHSYSRLLKQFTDRKLDCASPVAVPIEGAVYTDAYLPFQDVAISLKRSALRIDNLADLAQKRIVAYQQANQVLGADFSKAVAQANYLELAERELQLDLLFNGRVDVVIGERRVLHYLAAKIAPQIALSNHKLFAEKMYPAACWRAELSAIFNRGLAQLRHSGELEHMLQQYNQGNAIGTK
jgi:polar amino acid transport system substrate-binding protein